MISHSAAMRGAWKHLLSQKFAFRPRWWNPARKGSSPPDFYYVFLGTRAGSVQLGMIFRKSNGWDTILLPAVLPTRDEEVIPVQFKAYRDRHQTDIGRFKTRKLAAEALKKASLDRGMLAERRAELLHPLVALAHEAGGIDAS